MREHALAQAHLHSHVGEQTHTHECTHAHTGVSPSTIVPNNHRKTCKSDSQTKGCERQTPYSKRVGNGQVAATPHARSPSTTQANRENPPDISLHNHGNPICEYMHCRAEKIPERAQQTAAATITPSNSTLQTRQIQINQKGRPALKLCRSGDVLLLPRVPTLGDFQVRKKLFFLAALAASCSPMKPGFQPISGILRNLAGPGQHRSQWATSMSKGAEYISRPHQRTSGQPTLNAVASSTFLKLNSGSYNVNVDMFTNFCWPPARPDYSEQIVNVTVTDCSR